MLVFCCLLLLLFFFFFFLFFFFFFFFCGFFSFWVLCDFQISLNPWLGCEEHVECAWAQELNGRQVLFKCGHGRYWYLRDWVLAQVQHVYPLQMILAHPCPFIWLANLLANEEIAHARVGHIVLGTSGDYLEFVQTQLQGCLAGISRTSVAFFLSPVNLHPGLHPHLLSSLLYLLWKYLHVALLGFIL